MSNLKIRAYSLQNQVLLELPLVEQRLERRDGAGGDWMVLTSEGFVAITDDVTPIPVMGNFLDKDVFNGISQYRARLFSDDDSKWGYTVWLKVGTTMPIGYSFGNYRAPEGSWGEILTPADLNLTYLWGVDFRASNGASYSDAQIKFFIDEALERTERLLNITIKKQRRVTDPDSRGLKKGEDYDVEEAYYIFKRENIQRNGFIKTKTRPVISLSRLDLLSRSNTITSLLRHSILDKTKGVIRFTSFLPKLNDTQRAVASVISPHGPDFVNRTFNYAIDYVAGYETSDDVPADLRGVIGKMAAVELMNNIGRGLMAGFSSSSLSMDGVSESFSSTQCATSAFYGADIKAYEENIKDYLHEMKIKFSKMQMTAL